MIEDPEGPHAHHHKTGIAWLDLALAMAVIALSVASLVTAHHTGNTMERLVDANSRLVRANSTPLLQLSTGNVTDAGRGIYFSLTNAGTGTARVIWFELARVSKPARNIRELIGYAPLASEKDYITTDAVADTLFPAGDKRAFVQWKRSTSPASIAAWDSLDRARASLRATACFCSVLGECWTSHLRADLPQPVAACDARGHTNFEG